MQITEYAGAEGVELRVVGRIDATWADHLSTRIENVVRGGAHRVVLNFEGVDYISSLGIRVLVVHYQQLKRVKGDLAIRRPSAFCRNVLTTVGLGEIIAQERSSAVMPAIEGMSKQRIGDATYELYPQRVEKPLSCSLIGRPERLSQTGFAADDCCDLKFGKGSFGLGLGAFGESYEDCVGRFGEFLAAGGCAITMPTSDANELPDYIIEEGNLVPDLKSLYAIAGNGDFAMMGRFDVVSDGAGKIALSELIESLMELAGSQAIAFTALVEVAGVVGAALLRSPAGRPLLQQLPEVRDWLTFTTERRADKALCLLVGAASRGAQGNAAEFLRPIVAGSPLETHIHAATFPYRPVQRGELQLEKTVSDLLAGASPRAVLHLMTDTRPIDGVGESELSRGAFWFSPLPVNLEG